MLVPVIGLVSAGEFAHADRNTYLPGIGLAMAVNWAVADGSAGWQHRRLVLGGLMMAVVAALSVCSHIQTSYWKDSETLWRHTLACTSGNGLANKNLGLALITKGETEAAIEHFRKVVEIKPARRVLTTTWALPLPRREIRRQPSRNTRRPSH